MFLRLPQRFGILGLSLLLTAIAGATPPPTPTQTATSRNYNLTVAMSDFAQMALASAVAGQNAVPPQVEAAIEKLRSFYRQQTSGAVELGEKVVAVESANGGRMRFFRTEAGPPPTEDGNPWKIGCLFRFSEDDPEFVYWNVQWPTDDLAIPSQWRKLTAQEAKQKVEALLLASNLGDAATVSKVSDESGWLGIDYSVRSGAFFIRYNSGIWVDPYFALPTEQTAFRLEVPQRYRAQITLSEPNARSMAVSALQSEASSRRLGSIRFSGPVVPVVGEAEGIPMVGQDGSRATTFFGYGNMALLAIPWMREKGSGFRWSGRWPIHRLDGSTQETAYGSIGEVEVTIDAVNGEVMTVKIALDKTSAGFGRGEELPLAPKSPFRWDRLGPLKSVVVGGKTLKAGGEIGGTGPWVTGRRIPVMLVLAKSLVPAEYDALSQTFIVESNGEEVFGKAPTGMAKMLENTKLL